MRMLLVLLALTLATVGAQAPASVHIEALQGPQLVAELVGFDAAKGFVLRRDGVEVFAPFATTVALVAAVAQPVAASRATIITLLDGSTLRGLPAASRGDGFDFETQGAGVIPLLLDDVGRIDFSAIELPQAHAEDDLLCFRRGDGVDALPGEVLGFGRDGVRFRSAAGERVWNPQRDAVAGLRLRTQPVPATPKGPRAVVALKDGSRLFGVLEGPGLKLRLVTGFSAALDPARVAALEPFSPRFARLSDLELELIAHKSLLDGATLPALALDHGLVPETGLVIGTRAWRRGIAVRARSELACELRENWKRITLHVGADAAGLRAGVRASVRAAIFADAHELWRSDLLVAGEPAVVVDVALPQGTKLLRLVVEHGASHTTGARAIFADALLHAP
ncbi:MAG: hypothetical protein EXS14_04755 [Planctomycetes bacterium]|nr:hypothetical protein [Planctomycetota bacterium]